LPRDVGGESRTLAANAAVPRDTALVVFQKNWKEKPAEIAQKGNRLNGEDRFVPSPILV